MPDDFKGNVYKKNLLGILYWPRQDNLKIKFFRNLEKKGEKKY